MWVGGNGLGVELNKKSGYITQLPENRPSLGVGMRMRRVFLFYLFIYFYRHSGPFGCLISFAGYSDLLQRDAGGGSN